MPSLILEGGTFRPIFSAGVMDALLDNDIIFPYCIGVSAGITNGVSYISKQKGRNLAVIEQYRNDKRYLGLKNFTVFLVLILSLMKFLTICYLSIWTLINATVEKY